MTDEVDRDESAVERLDECLPGPEVIKLFSCSTQWSINFKQLINTQNHSEFQV